MGNLFDLTGRVAVITGGNGGIGLGIAEALAQQGATVSIWGRNAEKNAKAVAGILAKGDKAEAHLCDVTDKASIEAAFQATLQNNGRIDGCFANAGVSGGAWQSFVDRDEAEWRRMFATNLDGVVNSFKPIVRHMIERASKGDAFGRLVATSSMASLFGTARNEHYAATKAGVNAIIKALAVEHARYGITANAILPGWITTDMTERLSSNPKFMENVIPRIPMRRFGKPEDFGGIACYLMSETSRYHTADLFVIDGAYSSF